MSGSRTARVAVASMLALGIAACGSNGDPKASTPEKTAADEARPDVGWLAYQSRAAKVALVRADGSGNRSVADWVGRGPQSNPDWSPDGRRLVFAATDADDDDTDDLWTVDASGANATRLLDCEAPCAYLDDPAWSPDGDSIVYSRIAHDGAGIRATLETVDVDSGKVRVLLVAEPNTAYAGPRWSPDGSQIVMELLHLATPTVDSDVTGVALSIVAAEPGATPRPITAPELFAATADWSPDGELIVYSALAAAGAEASDLFTIRPDGSGRHQVTRVTAEGGIAEHPTFALDGRSITFVLYLRHGDGGLATVPVEGGTPRPAVGTEYLPGDHPRYRPSR